MSTEPLRILLIDAVSDNTTRFRSLLRGPLCQLDAVADLAAALAAVRDDGYDAIVMDGSAEAPRLLRWLGSMGVDAALLVLRSGTSGAVPLHPEDVGHRSTLDLDGLDPRTLALTLQLAVERHRVSRLQAAAATRGPAGGGLHGSNPSHDPVTGLMTGEVMLEGIDRMIADAVRFSRPLTIAVARIDGLDEVRRTLGRAGVQRLEVQVVGLVLADVRTCDLIGRLDDGQFVLGLSATSAQSALLPLRRLQQAVRSAPAPTPVSRPTSLSVGVCPLAGLMSVDEMVYDAMRAAEDATASGGDAVVLTDGRASLI